MTLGDLLLENRIVFLAGVINDMSAIEIVMKLLFLQYENRTQEIHFYISSPGGSVISTLAIYDTMQFLECPVATYCIGMAASGGAILLTGGTKGKRYALPHAKVMIHQPWGQVGRGAEHHAVASIHQFHAAASITRPQHRQHRVAIDVIRQHTGQSARRDRFGAGEHQRFGQAEGIFVRLPQ